MKKLLKHNVPKEKCTLISYLMYSKHVPKSYLNFNIKNPLTKFFNWILAFKPIYMLKKRTINLIAFAEHISSFKKL